MVNVNTVVLTMMDHMNVHATLDIRLEMIASPVMVSKNFKLIILCNNHSLPSPSHCECGGHLIITLTVMNNYYVLYDV